MRTSTNTLKETWIDMAGIVRFKVNKYVHGTRSKNVFDFKPKAQILFEGERIGHIIDRRGLFLHKGKTCAGRT